jgi:hypothetical protein
MRKTIISFFNAGLGVFGKIRVAVVEVVVLVPEFSSYDS